MKIKFRKFAAGFFFIISFLLMINITAFSIAALLSHAGIFRPDINFFIGYILSLISFILLAACYEKNLTAEKKSKINIELFVFSLSFALSFILFFKNIVFTPLSPIMNFSALFTIKHFSCCMIILSFIMALIVGLLFSLLAGFLSSIGREKTRSVGNMFHF